MNDNTPLPEKLCLACGLCCSGVLFRDVELQPGDDVTTLAESGLPIRHTRTGTGHALAKIPQPCAALEGCRCRIYEGRPTRCREFNCALLQAVLAGETTPESAGRVIRSARQRADQVRALLRALADHDEHLPLSRRFRRTQRRIEATALDDATADLYGELTLAVHDLNRLLAENFYTAS